MHQTLPNVDFGSIRLLRGKQTDAFEELSVQLFNGETEGQGEFFAIDGSGGDGGVEAYRTRADGTKVAVQSKYFDKLGTSQWNQITKSVKSAIANHPTLRTYIVSTPLNRTPAQTKKWQSLTAEWLDHAKSLGIIEPIEFLWWGYTELAALLAKGRYRNQLVYWLGVPDFSQDWLNAINQSNIALLGKRYSPKQHIETESGIRLEAFAWGDQGKKRILNAFLKASEQWRKLDRREVAKAKTTPESKDLTEIFRGIMREIISFRWPQSGYPPIRPLSELCQAAIDACHELERTLRKLNHAEKEKLAKERGGTANYQSGPYESLIYDLRQLADTVADLSHATNLCLAADDSRLLLLGEAGSGKSHLIADVVTSATSRSQPALLLLGERYLGSDDPWTATVDSLGWHHTAEDLLAALDQEGQLAGRPALLCIDALNESEHRRLWQSHLIEFAERVSHYPHVKLLVSCRSDFARITLPDAVRPDTETAWSSVHHQGYGAEVIEAIAVYFSEFDIRAPYFPPALAEFRNPLFLRVFCEAFAGQELPAGPLGLDQVMRARIDRLCTQIEKEIDCDPEDTRAALMAIAADIAEAGGRPIPRKTARARAANHFPNRDASKSLYARLISNGILVESVNYAHAPTQEEEVTVRFPFERFSDYFIALQILNGIETTDQFTSLFEDGRPLAHLKGYWQYVENRGIARALAIMAPERLGLEFAEVLREPTVHEMVLEDFLESLAWRSSDSFSQSSESLLDEARQEGIDLLPIYIRLSTIPEHPFNSEYLGARLASLPLPDRELAWTIPVADRSASSDDNILEEFLHWCFRVPTHLIPDNQAILAGRLLLWFCTSNHRELRKRATIAAIRLLVGRSQAVCALISELNTVDDSYLLERLYAVATGVAIRLSPGEDISSLAESVYTAVFAQEQVNPNILIRDFSSAVMEICWAKGSLPSDIPLEGFRPPFVTFWPSILSEDEATRFERDESWRSIVHSVRTEGMGMYGDFGRYVMEAKIHRFSDRLLTEDPPEPDYKHAFRGEIARRWVLQRVEELGWTAERFGEYERGLPFKGRQRVDIEESRLERISKKYQWIALREFLGFLSDHYWLARSWGGEVQEYRGAWQTWTREFDPSQRLIDPISESTDESYQDLGGAEFETDYPDPFKDSKLCDDREAWVTRTPDGFQPLLTPKTNTSDPDQSWLALAGHFEWREPEYERVVRGRRGKLTMWANIRSFLVHKQDRPHFVKKAGKKHFYGSGVGFPEFHDGWIGEYPWRNVFDDLREYCEESDERVGDLGLPYWITACSWSNGSALVPSPRLCELLRLEWAGAGAEFRSMSDGDFVVKHLGGDPSNWGRPLLVKRDALRVALDAGGMDLVWCIVAERGCWCAETETHVAAKELEISAVYWLDGNAIRGNITQQFTQDLQRSASRKLRT